MDIEYFASSSQGVARQWSRGTPASERPSPGYCFQLYSTFQDVRSTNPAASSINAYESRSLRDNFIDPPMPVDDGSCLSLGRVSLTVHCRGVTYNEQLQSAYTTGCASPAGVCTSRFVAAALSAASAVEIANAI
ncbi:hypothetical protein EVAR_28213_1 [Eumeta japonica]|uniref:Uncharacterized protein n=1 Tax=Eumeta variegata TaxID=151549 RepID=A0A4C1VL08_EUMVA|nr:hypothetical protein EVAR_28213_1 [Eumeta japonica]